MLGHWGCKDIPWWIAPASLWSGCQTVGVWGCLPTLLVVLVSAQIYKHLTWFWNDHVEKCVFWEITLVIQSGFINYVNKTTGKMASFYKSAWEMVEGADWDVASLRAGMQSRSHSHPWVWARSTSDTVTIEGKANWGRGRDWQGISGGESLSPTAGYPGKVGKGQLALLILPFLLFPAWVWATHNFLGLWAMSCFF